MRELYRWSLAFGVTCVFGCNWMLGNDPPGAFVPEVPPSGGSVASGGALAAGGTSSGGSPESGGSHTTGGAPAATTIGVIGASCVPNGVYACAGQNQRVQLTCKDGKWESLAQCDSTERCDTRMGQNAGVCESVVPECEDKEPGSSAGVCEGDVPKVCGVDRVSLESAAACGPTLGCRVGRCEAKRSECSGLAENTWICAASGTERIQCGTNETEASRQVCARGCTGGWCDIQSCAGLAPACGPTANGDCCESPFVPTGSFLRGTDSAAPATVTGFRLDKYEVTVGRFRAFKKAWEGNYRPTAGAGKHVHVNAGQGLSDGMGGFEVGWDAAWEAQVNVSDVAREGSYTTWTATEGNNENLPVNYVNWFEGAAFCIWDGGFLPSETEWEYVATGGGEERTYPWGEASPGCDHANFVLDGASCSDTSTHSNPVGSLPLGEGLWKQSDLAGNVREWCLDWDAPFMTQCTDCAEQRAGTLRSCRGGANSQDQAPLGAAVRVAVTPTTRAVTTGLRCARAP